MLKRAVLLSMLILFSLSSCAYVFGDIYGQNLAKVNKTVVEVQGPFTYQLVTDKANYSLYLPPGQYNLSASTYDSEGNLALYATQQVTVGTTDQQVDLVLNPIQFPYEYPLLLLGIIIAITIAFMENRKNRTQSPTAPISPVEKIVKPDSEAIKVLEALERMEGRATQKELKESLGFSDAKLSLILAELEDLRKIKKFKRGRGNIIRKI